MATKLTIPDNAWVHVILDNVYVGTIDRDWVVSNIEQCAHCAHAGVGARAVWASVCDNIMHDEGGIWGSWFGEWLDVLCAHIDDEWWDIPLALIVCTDDDVRVHIHTHDLPVRILWDV